MFFCSRAVCLYFPKGKQSSNQNADPVSDGSWLYSVCFTVFGHSENVVILFAQRIELTALILFTLHSGLFEQSQCQLNLPRWTGILFK